MSLSTDQIARLRSTLNLSPGGRFAVERERDRVVLTDRDNGSQSIVPLKVAVDELTVSDGGDVVVTWLELDRETYLASHCLGRLQPDGEVRPMPAPTASWKGPTLPELSADGTRLAYSDPEGGLYLDGKRVALPGHVRRNAFLDDGRLLVVTETAKVPRCHLVDPSGQVQHADLALADALGVPARERLAEAWAAAVPGATPRQCQELVDQFGYRTPEGASSQNVFWVPRGAEGEPWGLHVLGAGPGLPTGRPDRIDSSPDGRGAAVRCGDRVAVVNVPAGSRVLPGEVEAVEWSLDGRWLATQGPQGVEVLDTRTGDLTPVAQGRLQGWSGGDVLVGDRSFPIGTLDGDVLREELLGGKDAAAAGIQVGSAGVRIGGIVLPLHD